MITFGTLGLSLSAAVARAVLAFAATDPTLRHVSGLGIDEGDVCATDGHAAVRFEKCAIDDGAPAPTRWNGRVFARRKVEAALKAAGPRGVVVLQWADLEPSEITFAQLSKVEPKAGVRDEGLPIGWSPELLARIEVAAKACRREREKGELGEPLLPPAMLVSLGGHLDPCRYEIGGASWANTAHTAQVTIMPVNMRAKGESADERKQREAIQKTAARKAAEQKRAAKAERERAEPAQILAYGAGRREDERARTELLRLSGAKLREPWAGRPAQKQVLANILSGREGVTPALRQQVQALMVGRPLSDLRFAVVEAFGAPEVAA